MPQRYDKDPYAILGVPPSATSAQIKKAYHRLARQYHPDLNHEPHAAERMKDINWAYAILNNPTERLHYDRWRYAASAAESQPRQTQSPNSTYAPRPSYSSRPGGINMGWSFFFILWTLCSFISNIPRLFQQRAEYPTLSADARSTTVALLISIPLTLTAEVEQTTFPPMTVTATTTPSGEFIDIRGQITPGTLEWEWINTLLGEYYLTTPNGLSNEVTRVQRNLFTGEIIIETQHNGSFRIYLDKNQKQAVVHFPPTPASTEHP